MVVVVMVVVVVVRQQVMLAPDAEPSASGAISWSVRRLQVRHTRGPREATALGKSPRVTAACHRRVSPQGLVDTDMLRPYMHGFFIDARLHAKATSLSQPFVYEQWRKGATTTTTSTTTTTLAHS